MSYDLYLKPRYGQIDRETFLGYFRDRPYYETEEAQAIYSHPDTGVYFLFDWNEEPDDDAESGESHYPIAFNLNYFRPSVFAHEAAPELAALVRALDLVVLDPQNEGMGEGDFSVEGFVRGWSAGNAFAYEAILKDEGFATLDVLPSDVLHRAWQWNRQRNARTDALSQRSLDRFVPKVMFFRLDGRTVTGVVWTDGIPMEAPPADVVLVYRDKLAPRRFFSRKEDYAILQWPEFAALADPYGAVIDGDVRLIKADPPPSALVNAIRKLPSLDTSRLVALEPGSVLDAELVEQAFQRVKENVNADS
jgi:hypothetical protein